MDKLGEVGEVLSGISKAIKTMKEIRQKNSTLYAVIEETKKNAMAVEEVKLPGNKLLDQLKESLRKVLESGGKLEVFMLKLADETDRFERFARQKILKSGAVPQEDLKQFCDELNEMHKMAQDFSVAFVTYTSHLTNSQQIAVELETQQKQLAEEQTKRANKKAVAGGTVAGTIVVLGGALAFFTFGASLVAAGVAAAALGAGTAIAVKTGLDVHSMKKMAADILDGANQLSAIANRLKSSSDKTGSLQLSAEHVEALQTALDHYRASLGKDEKIIQLEEEKEGDKARIRDLEEQLRRALAK